MDAQPGCGFASTTMATMAMPLFGTLVADVDGGAGDVDAAMVKMSVGDVCRSRWNAGLPQSKMRISCRRPERK